MRPSIELVVTRYCHNYCIANIEEVVTDSSIEQSHTDSNSTTKTGSQIKFISSIKHNVQQFQR